MCFQYLLDWGGGVDTMQYPEGDWDTINCKVAERRNGISKSLANNARHKPAVMRKLIKLQESIEEMVDMMEVEAIARLLRTSPIHAAVFALVSPHTASHELFFAKILCQLDDESVKVVACRLEAKYDTLCQPFLHSVWSTPASCTPRLETFFQTIPVSAFLAKDSMANTVLHHATTHCEDNDVTWMLLRVIVSRVTATHELFAMTNVFGYTIEGSIERITNTHIGERMRFSSKYRDIIHSGDSDYDDGEAEDDSDSDSDSDSDED